MEHPGACHMDPRLDSRFFPLIFNSISHGIFTIDSESRITSFNRTAEELTGYTADEAVGRLCSEVFQSDMCQTCPLKTSIDTGESGEDHEVTIITKSGHPLPISISTAALCAEDGRIIGAVMGTHDARKGWINRLAVHPDHRRRGVASALAARVEQSLAEDGMEIFAALIEDENETSCRLFEALGYEIYPVHYYRKKLHEGV